MTTNLSTPEEITAAIIQAATVGDMVQVDASQHYTTKPNQRVLAFTDAPETIGALGPILDLRLEHEELAMVVINLLQVVVVIYEV